MRIDCPAYCYYSSCFVCLHYCDTWVPSLVTEQNSASRCITQDGSLLCVFVGAAKILSLASKISRKEERVPPAPGHSLLPKTISIAECFHFYQTKSPHGCMTVMNWDCRRYYSVLLLQHHRCRDRTDFWVGFGREGWELRCETKCKLATHLLLKSCVHWHSCSKEC